jgi:hypothetical protein
MGSIMMSSKELRISRIANLPILNLIGLNSLSGANILSRCNSCLCQKTINLSLAVDSMNAGIWESNNQLGTSLSFRIWCCYGKGKKTRNSKYLHHVEIAEIVRDFPRWSVRLR